MKVYVLVAKNEDGEQSFDMPIYFHRAVRAYSSKGRARAYARRFNAAVIELDTENGKEIENNIHRKL